MEDSARYRDLEEASVLITGGGTGIGACLTMGFIRQGSRVAFIDIADRASRDLCRRLEEETGREPLFLHADLRDVDALKEAVRKAEIENGPVSVLVNNAALDNRHTIEEVTPEFWDENQAINLRHQFFAAQAVMPGMKEARRGSIVNFTSTAFIDGEERASDVANIASSVAGHWLLWGVVLAVISFALLALGLKLAWMSPMRLGRRSTRETSEPFPSDDSSA